MKKACCSIVLTFFFLIKFWSCKTSSGPVKILSNKPCGLVDFFPKFEPCRVTFKLFSAQIKTFFVFIFVQFTTVEQSLILHRGNGGNCLDASLLLPWCPSNAWKVYGNSSRICYIIGQQNVLV